MDLGEWVDKYKPITNKYENDAPFNGTLFSVSEKDLVHSTPANNVWTLIEVEKDMYIENGYHLVNRIGFFITEIPFTDQNSEMLIEVNG